MNEEQIISDPSDLKKYRTELPNLYDDAELDVYQFRLLAHYKRVGRCTEGLETTAKKCGMSEGKASETRAALADKGWIALQRVSMDKGRYRYIVTVNDRWIENFAKYSGLTVEEIAEQIKNASPSPREPIPSPREASPSPREGKKELLKNLKTLSHADFAKMTVQEAREVPTLKMYATATEFFPGSVVWEYVHNFIVSNNLTEDQIKAAAIAWSLRGYRKENVEGILQWALDGVQQKGKGAKNGNAGRTKGLSNQGKTSLRQDGQAANSSDDQGANEQSAEQSAAADKHRERWAGLRKKSKVPAVQ